jgi:hypothetical protein
MKKLSHLVFLFASCIFVSCNSRGDNFMVSNDYRRFINGNILAEGCVDGIDHIDTVCTIQIATLRDRENYYLYYRKIGEWYYKYRGNSKVVAKVLYDKNGKISQINIIEPNFNLLDLKKSDSTYFAEW